MKTAKTLTATLLTIAALALSGCSMIGAEPPNQQTCAGAQVLLSLVCPDPAAAVRSAVGISSAPDQPCGMVELLDQRQRIRLVTIDGLQVKQKGDGTTRVVPANGDAFDTPFGFDQVSRLINAARCPGG